MLDGGGGESVPAQLRVEMRVDVDEAGGEHLAACVEFGIGRTGEVADGENLSVFDGDVAMLLGRARTVDDPRVADDQVCVAHVCSFCLEV